MKAKNAPGDGLPKKEARAPSMLRSRGQLASAYAPGAIFTFEGGLGACEAIPDQHEFPAVAQVSEQTKVQMHLRLRELWQNWFAQAMQGGTDKHTVLPTQCLDMYLLRNGGFHAPQPSAFEFVNPRSMGYVPAPLAFVCNHCGRFKGFNSVRATAESLSELSSERCRSKDASNLGKCRWRQLDVIFVHWSGNWAAPTPGRWEWSRERQEVQSPIRACSVCKSQRFYLRDKSPRIGEWFFECENGHKDGDSWLQNDEDTTSLLGDECRTRPPRWRRMEPISYRASSAFYSHYEQFVAFEEEQHKLLELLQESKQEELAGFLAEKYGIGVSAPSVDDILEMLERAGHETKVTTYRQMKGMRDSFLSLGNAAMVSQVEVLMEGLVADWKKTPGLIPAQHDIPEALIAQVRRRSEFGSRYDPMTLAIEHEALHRSKLSKTTSLDGRAPYVRFTALDHDLAPKNAATRNDQQRRTAALLPALGIEDMGLIREFDLCRFTHGYTRMSTDPTIEKMDPQKVRLPVRLRLFPRLGNGKLPIYVVTQANEAIYIRLNPGAVFEWLRQVGVVDLPDWTPTSDVKLGAHLLQLGTPFGKYFSELHPGDPTTYRYVYTLLHSYAHTLMKAVAEFSGLDLGSLGEYLFPADLAFVVYRNGTTMDLGNLSALWRNYSDVFLAHLLSPRTLACGSGSLCDASGGACPDCLMIPETSCVASNQLLSRAVLRTGEAPREDLMHKGKQIPGYLDVAQGLLNA